MNDDEELSDLVTLIDELNQHSDLTVKLNNQSKICKILETNDDFGLKNQQQTADTNEDQKNVDLKVKDIMDSCK